MSNNLAQNHAITMLGVLNRLLFRSSAYVEEDSSRLCLLSVESSSFFLMGRDTDQVPFIAAPAQVQPAFSMMDWSRLSLFRRSGYVFLEILDPKKNTLLFSLGFRVRRDRQSIFCHPTEENPYDMYLNIKTFVQDPKDHSKVVIADRNDITRISMREIHSLQEIDSDVNQEDAQMIMEGSGAASSVSIVSIGSRFK